MKFNYQIMSRRVLSTMSNKCLRELRDIEMKKHENDY